MARAIPSPAAVPECERPSVSPLIGSVGGDFENARAALALAEGQADIVTFGRSFLLKPDPQHHVVQALCRVPMIRRLVFAGCKGIRHIGMSLNSGISQPKSLMLLDEAKLACRLLHHNWFVGARRHNESSQAGAWGCLGAWARARVLCQYLLKFMNRMIAMVVISLKQADSGSWSVYRAHIKLFSDLQLEPAIALAKEMAEDEHERTRRPIRVEMPGLASTLLLATYGKESKAARAGEMAA